MISFVRGSVAAITLNAVVIDVGGLGHHVLCTPGTIAGLRLGQEAQLATSLVVREDSLTLYGFADLDERDIFELVQTASGVGPKVAQAMVAVLPPDRLRTAIASADHAALTQVPGIGRKGAERIILELKDRIGSPGIAAAASPAQVWKAQVHEALLGLGYNAKDADRAVESVAQQFPTADVPEVPTLLREALRALSKA